MRTRFVTLMISLVLAALSSREAFGKISSIWANDGGDKVTQDELRATRRMGKIFNTVWDGNRIYIFGGQNEVISFNVVLEAGNGPASNVSVSFKELTGPSGRKIASGSANGNGVFNWNDRQIELFYIRYLQINGISTLSYAQYDERHTPYRMRRPWSGDGMGRGTWNDRPDHNKFYPDIAVPIELVPTFNIASNQNQSIWVDVYIPKNAAPGLYEGQFIVREGGAQVASLPVKLQVCPVTLPDMPLGKTMLYYSSGNISKRYLGTTYANAGTSDAIRGKTIRDRHFMLAHRHKISLIGDDTANCGNEDQPCPEWTPRLDGSLFTAGNGYDGPGVGVGNNVYAIGTYGNWSWKTHGQSGMNQHSDAWASWFARNAPNTEYFLYLADELQDLNPVENWAKMLLKNSGAGRQMKTLATSYLPHAAKAAPSLDIPVSTLFVGAANEWQPLVDRYTSDSRKRFWMYNGHRPATGSFATEDDGVALRQLEWAAFKKKVQRWFFWESTYYNNFQGNTGEMNVFRTAHTFGYSSLNDSSKGRTGLNYANGDGILFYPGTDKVFPSDSYGVDGPLASLRLKHWRRGVQDYDYLAMASATDAATVKAIINSMIPKVLWENGIADPNDPSWVRCDISWPIDPDKWEIARAQLISLITGVNPLASYVSSTLPAPTLRLPDQLPVSATINVDYPAGYNGVSFVWSIRASGASNAAPASDVPAGNSAHSASFKTTDKSASLARYSLAPGRYSVTVQAVDGSGQISAPSEETVTLVLASDLEHVQVFPNPWRQDRHAGTPVTFSNLPPNSTIKIFTVAAHHVKTIHASGAAATWDLKTDAGDEAASGLYVYMISSEGQKGRGKFALIR
jgi:hypothetical protein